jgi:hypothetical protein
MFTHKKIDLFQPKKIIQDFTIKTSTDDKINLVKTKIIFNNEHECVIQGPVGAVSPLLD